LLRFSLTVTAVWLWFGTPSLLLCLLFPNKTDFASCPRSYLPRQVSDYFLIGISDFLELTLSSLFSLFPSLMDSFNNGGVNIEFSTGVELIQKKAIEPLIVSDLFRLPLLSQYLG
jgi:hypothetical protein